MLLNEFTSALLKSTQLAQHSYLSAAMVTSLQALMNLKYGNLELMEDDTATSFIDNVQNDVNTVFTMNDYKYSEMTRTIINNYDILQNTNITESENTSASGTDTDSGSDSTTSSGTNTGTVQNSGNETRTDNTDQAESARTYNDVAMTVVKSLGNSGTVGNVNSNTRTDNLSDSNQTAITYGKIKATSDTEEITRNRSGLDGMTVADALEKDRHAALFSLYEIMALDIVNNICDLNYVASSL